MSAYCRRITAGTAASTAAMSQIQLRRAEVLQLPREFVVTDRRRGIVLRSSSRRRWVMEAVGLRSDGGGGVEEEKKIRPCSYAVGDQRAVGNLVGGGGSGEVVAEAGGGVEGDRTVEVLVAAGVTVVLGVGNRVLYKLALVPLKHYPFFLAQLATFGYVIVYFSILYLRYHAGIVTDEMLSLPKAPFLAVGLLEALGAAAGMAAGGEDLSDLAVEYSICPSKEEGGMLGWVRKGQMVPEFEEAAFNASVNKVVRCKTKFGWHLLQVLSEREESVLQDIQPDELHGKMQDPCFIEAAQLIDVREPDEVAQASLPGFHVLPLRQFGSWGPEITTKFDPQKDTYVLVCTRILV
ncbi:hypothetical protein HYC85_024522 [Camellia sinensis]|uniref:Peptidylprolyl isomerase n=1 Tax=Camellia sinensis TaxID=4442 RepID=A0A7J7GCJ5_CAMSI|nr:hypothetical protein HYC85_024522 [Camellia sinensis]